MKDIKYGIHWFRRDLRVAGNLGLQFNWQQCNANTLGVFCFDQKFLARPDFSVNRFQFFLKTLKSLKLELQQAGGDLLVLNQEPVEAFKSVLNLFKKNNVTLPALVTWNRDYEPYAINRDQKIQNFLKEQNINTNTFRDHLIIEPHELTKNNSEEGYQVFTPFSKKWLELLSTDKSIVTRLDTKNLGFDYLKKLKSNSASPFFKLTWQDLLKKNTPRDYLEEFIKENQKKVTVDIPDAGTLKAFEQLDLFTKKIKNYESARDIPGLEATSKMSLFLKNGSITTSQIIAKLKIKPYKNKPKTGEEKFLSELIWREFYYHILFRNPNVEKESFNTKYKDIKWENNKAYFNKWKEGLTGFPIVDAGMRELKTTGWMHNRVRMIVASFLTKDLLIDWRWGEKYFMETLLDGDLAPNNGGWQWAASTGCDPQPYFRIFNPWSQSLKFDPEAEYIKKYIPELKNTDPKSIHDEQGDRPLDYPRPIVDHKTQRIEALKLYK